MSEWVRVCDVDEISDGKMLSFDHGDKKLLIVKYGGNLYAMDRTCTHEDADLSTGFLSEEGVRCSLHLSVFGFDDGVPKNPPATEPVEKYNIKIQQDGVYVEI